MLSFARKRNLRKSKNLYIEFEDEVLLPFIKKYRGELPQGACFIHLSNFFSAVIQLYEFNHIKDNVKAYIDLKLIEEFSLGKDLINLSHSFDKEKYPEASYRTLDIDKFDFEVYKKFLIEFKGTVLERFPIRELDTSKLFPILDLLNKAQFKNDEIPLIEADFAEYLAFICQ